MVFAKYSADKIMINHTICFHEALSQMCAGLQTRSSNQGQISQELK